MKPLKEFNADRRGVAAIEFALIAPLLLLIILGSVTLFHFYRTGLALDRATATVTDLMSRQKELTRDFIDTRVALSLNALVTHEPGKMEMRITSLTKTGGALTADWTYPTTAGPRFADRPLPAELLPDIAEGDSILLAETVVQQSALFDLIGILAVDHRATAAVRPRFAKMIKGP